VDTAALEAELMSGRIAAILDVTDPDPLPAGHPLLGLPHVFVTPHVAGALGNELHRLAELAVQEVERFTRGEPPLHPVRREDLDRIA
jgi:phosphoglycerate dehydrogenase-like enzyme